MIAATLVQEIAEQFRAADIADAAQEAEELARVLLGLTKTAYLSTSPELTAEQEVRIRKSADRRSAGEPLHYIIGFLEFMGLHISVGPGVLIPRPETELLVEETIKVIKSGKREVRRGKSENNAEARKSGTAEAARQESESGTWNPGVKNQKPENDATINNQQSSIINSSDNSSFSNHQSAIITILDLCTGSGCIALSLARTFPDALVWGVDISPQALAYARQNAGANAIPNVTFAEGDLFAPVAGRRFRCITANPPYIKASDIRNLQVEIREHEPLGALDGGPDGLDYYRRIVAEAPQYLEPDGMLILELGYDQSGDVSAIAAENGFVDIRCLPDYAGIRRIFIARVPA